MSIQDVTRQPPDARSPSVAGFAWVILTVVWLASVAASLNQFKVPPLIPVLMEAFRLDLSQAGYRIGSRRLLVAIPFLAIAGMMLFPFHVTG